MDLWAMIQQHHQQAGGAAAAQQDQLDTNFLVVGSKGAGKTTLIQSFQRKDSGSNSALKPTTALDYSHVRTEENKQIKCAHFWEIGGAQQLASLLEVVITVENIHTVAVMIVADLSQPHSVFDTVWFWLQKIKKRVAECFTKMAQKQSQTPGKMLQRMTKRFGENHPDLKNAKDKGQAGIICGIPILIVANKYDQFRSQQSEYAKVMAKTLRWLAHSNGASLVYTPGDKGHGAADTPEIQRYRGLVTNMAFQGAPLSVLPATDHTKSIIVLMGKDAFTDIGAPSQAEKPANFLTTGTPEADKWKIQFEHVFPKPEGVVDAAKGGDEVNVWAPEYAEPVVDAMRAVKDDELESYRQERANRIKQQQTAAAAKAAPPAANRPARS
jgi:dynein light intermediate chain 2